MVRERVHCPLLGLGSPIIRRTTFIGCLVTVRVSAIRIIVDRTISFIRLRIIGPLIKPRILGEVIGSPRLSISHGDRDSYPRVKLLIFRTLDRVGV